MKRSGLLLSIVLGIMCASCQSVKSDKEAGYYGKDISGIAEVVRDRQTKSATLVINTGSEWTIYSGNQVDGIDFSQPLLSGKGSGEFSLSVPDTHRSYFQLETNEGGAILAESRLPMSGGFNYRDMGGIKTQDGRFVKWGKVFRSDDLHTLTEADLNYLSSLPLITVVDFRSEQEINQSPDLRPASLVNSFDLSISPGNLTVPKGMAPDDLSVLANLDVDSVMMAINRQLVEDPQSIAQYKKFFRLLEDEKNIPLLFHCTAGKDRTGMAAALFLFSLGVDEEVIMNNYLQSNDYIKEKFAPIIKKYPQAEPLMGVSPHFIQTGINYMKTNFGSVENYLKEVLEVDIPKLKDMYLY